jgi:hypothetical protein
MKRLVLSVVALATVLSGCALEPVQPWDRDLLAEDAMQLVPHPVNEYIAEHIYFSKEAASGGAGVGGGGCGCN